MLPLPITHPGNHAAGDRGNRVSAGLDFSARGKAEVVSELPVCGRPWTTGGHYFTRLTLIYTGSRSYRAGGKTYHLHQTVTYPLVASGGA